MGKIFSCEGVRPYFKSFQLEFRDDQLSIVAGRFNVNEEKEAVSIIAGLLSKYGNPTQEDHFIAKRKNEIEFMGDVPDAAKVAMWVNDKHIVYLITSIHCTAPGACFKVPRKISAFYRSLQEKTEEMMKKAAAESAAQERKRLGF